jgi:hypothetical protein
MHVDIQSIFGCQVGFEIADQETKEAIGMVWGVTFDLGIFRVVFAKFKEEE